MDFNFFTRKKILVRGPALSRSGYGHHARFLLSSLRRREDMFDIYLINVGWGETSWLWEDTVERAWYDFLINKTIHYIQNGGQFDISVQVTIPNEFERMAPMNIGVTAGIETTRIPPGWVEKCNQMDKIITISEFSKAGFVETIYEAQNKTTGVIDDDYRVKVPIEVVSYPAVVSEPVDVELNLTTDFNFLTIAQWSIRKNLPRTIMWFVKEFHDDENVGLIVKTNISKQCIPDRFECESRLKELLEDFPDKKCSVYLLHGDMSENELAGLMTNDKVKAYVAIPHGEGFGLSTFDAAIYGLPIITPGWSGHVDYLYWPEVKKRRVKGKLKEVETNKREPLFTEVEYSIGAIQEEAVWDGVLERGSGWCFADEASYRNQIRFVLDNYKQVKVMSDRLKKLVRDTFEPEKQYKLFCDSIWSPTQEEESWEKDKNKVEIF